MSSVRAWNSTIEGLKDLGHRMIAPDLRGFGKSSYKIKCSSLLDWASDIMELLDLLKIKKVFIVGWSFGGIAAQKIAEMRPDMVRKMIMVSSISHKGLVFQSPDGKLLKTQN